MEEFDNDAEFEESLSKLPVSEDIKWLIRPETAVAE